MNNHVPEYFETPLTLAVIRLFDRVLPLLEGKPSGAFKAYIFGGCALHMLTNARGSADVDAELEIAAGVNRTEIIALLDGEPEDYELNGRDMQVQYDTRFNTSLCPIHEDFNERAIPLSPGQEAARLQVFVAATIDLIITKLGRFTDRDHEDIRTLIRTRNVNLKSLDMLARQAIDYCPCDKSTTLSYLRLVLDEFGYQF
ncbi:hypothetical protein CSV86_001165 [Pseudomonas putida CSV86]|uniref:Uncharacterized protein n=1 Tax=Pseudomonas bharatica CSV86 TaxID=1005395 RepID=L1LZG2_9PSED|nr:DUF6036 family nucleotidyltransferase [Pseudomonas bharatica]NNJ13979.1 hypothetical protein [Pseudomonas bharatica CSV86]